MQSTELFWKMMATLLPSPSLFSFWVMIPLLRKRIISLKVLVASVHNYAFYQFLVWWSNLTCLLFSLPHNFSHTNWSLVLIVLWLRSYNFKLFPLFKFDSIFGVVQWPWRKAEMHKFVVQNCLSTFWIRFGPCKWISDELLLLRWKVYVAFTLQLQTDYKFEK